MRARWAGDGAAVETDAAASCTAADDLMMLSALLCVFLLCKCLPSTPPVSSQTIDALATARTRPHVRDTAERSPVGGADVLA